MDPKDVSYLFTVIYSWCVSVSGYRVMMSFNHLSDIAKEVIFVMR